MRSECLVTIHQPQYLPYLGLLAKIDAADTCVSFDTADYQKNYFDNRNRVLTKSGITWLTVPVHCSLKTPIRDTKIAGRTWVRKHLQTLRQAYGKAPFFEPYFSEFSSLLNSREFLFISDLAEATVGWLLNSFGSATSLAKASELGEEGNKNPKERLMELVHRSGGRGYLAGPSWRNYLTQSDVADFAKAGIAFYESEILEVRYAGCNGFHPNLSAVDLLFSCGKAGIDVIRNSIMVRKVSCEPAPFGDLASRR